LPDHFKRELREIKASLNRNAVRKWSACTGPLLREQKLKSYAVWESGWVIAMFLCKRLAMSCVNTTFQ
jgi:hypothetical protein